MKQKKHNERLFMEIILHFMKNQRNIKNGQRSDIKVKTPEIEKEREREREREREGGRKAQL